MLLDPIRARIGRLLERGVPAPHSTAPLRAVAAAWSALAARSVTRPVDLPPGCVILGVGGAVLGGAGKTPVAIALAAALAERGHAVALVGHAYRARPGAPRVVRPDDPIHLAGDDALCAARALAALRVPVVIAPRRGQALAHAARLGARVLVVDGLLQARPAPLAAGILLLDAAAPWGAGQCPPLGDLRAPPPALLAAADHVAALGTSPAADLPPSALLLPSTVTSAEDATGRSIPLADLAGARFGLLVGVARPARLVAALAASNLHPAVVLALADHAVFSRRDLDRAARLRVDAWLTTRRCATKLPARLGSAPVLALDHRVDVSGLVARLE